MTSSIQITGLKKFYNNTNVFDNFNLSIPQGRITALFGPNGSGKSTLFNIIAGLTKKDNGSVYIKDFDQYHFSYLPQNYRQTLLPWRTNFDNIALPLYIQHLPKEHIHTQVNTLITKYKIGINMKLYPYQISGGQQQIITLLRSLITKPKILLLDEPFSALDYKNNIKWRNYLLDYFLETQATIFMITHDIEEAVYSASEILIISGKTARIIAKIKNRFSYPRSIRDIQTKHFIEVSKNVRTAFQSVI